MNVLYLGPPRPAMTAFIEAQGDGVRCIEEHLAPDTLAWADFLVSYGYRHILKQDVLDLFPRKAINLHIAYLPYNRGADPNLWSILENTPKGTSLHYIDAGIDTGDLLAQDVVGLMADDTLATSYARLSRSIERLFFKFWPRIREGVLTAWRQPGGGTYHQASDRARVEHLLTKGWDTPVAGLIRRARDLP